MLAGDHAGKAVSVDEQTYLASRDDFQKMAREQRVTILRWVALMTDEVKPYPDLNRATPPFIIDTTDGPLLVKSEQMLGWYKREERVPAVKEDELIKKLGHLDGEGAIIVFSPDAGPELAIAKYDVQEWWRKRYYQAHPESMNLSAIPEHNAFDGELMRTVGKPKRSRPLKTYGAEAQSHQQAVAILKASYPGFDADNGLITILVGRGGDGINDWIMKGYKIW